MKRSAAYRCLAVAVIIGAVLIFSLPGGLVAATGGSPCCCHHGPGSGPGLVSGCCCQQTGMPGHCGGCGQGCGCAYRLGSGPSALSSPGAALGAPTWHSSPLVLTMFMAIKTFPSTIFHPPHFNQS
ncbi:MAG: hypothetical protein ACLPT6_12215 [Desulfobaccales bacterium]